MYCHTTTLSGRAESGNAGVAGRAQGFGGVGIQMPVGDGEMMGIDMLFALEIQRWHRKTP